MVIRGFALQITVNGKELPRTTQPFYFAVNKPKGYLCANVPNKEGTTKLVVDLFEVQLMLKLPPSLCAASSITSLPALCMTSACSIDATAVGGELM